MKQTTVLLLGVGALSLLTTVSCTFITTAVGTGFIGGFVLGKITLGMFLAAMSSLNGRPTGSISLGTQGTRDQEGLDIPDKVEIEVRDRFLRQLGKMDPLNCLPKVFCEVSADPQSASKVFGADAIKLLSQTSIFNPLSTKDKRKGPNTSYNNDQEEGDIGDDDSGSSQSNEDENNDDEPADDEAKIEALQKKEKEDIKTHGLEKFLEANDDPLTYYLSLIEKKKPVHPELMSMIKDVDFSSHRSLIKKPSTAVFRRRIDSLSSDRPLQKVGVSTTKSSIDDAFSDDPFFEEFSRSVRRPIKGGGSGGVVNVGLLRRNRRDTFGTTDDDITMAKYKIAAEVADMEDPVKCRRVFNTCPFTAEEVMNMISKLNAEDENKTLTSSTTLEKDKNDTSLTNLKNTLLVIEKLNDATFVAEALGQPVNYTKIVQDASESNTQVSDGSTKILNELDQLEEKFNVPESAEKVVKYKVPKRKFKKNKSKNKTDSVRIRRHDDGSRIRIENVKNKIQKGLMPTVARQQNGKLVLPGDRDDEFLLQSGEHLEARGHRFPVEEDSEEDDISPEVKVSSIYTGKKNTEVKHRPQSKVPPPSSKKKVEVLHSEQEDDEFNSPESEEVLSSVSVPGVTFSQTFIDTLGGPSLRKPKPKPIHRVVKVKPQSLRATTIRPSSSTTSTKRPTKATSSLPQLRKKYSGESEDDEEDAINTEKKIDVLVSKYKPREKLHVH